MLGGFPPGKIHDESKIAIKETVSKYFIRNTGVKTITDSVISTNKGSETTEVKRSPDIVTDDTEAAA